MHKELPGTELSLAFVDLDFNPSLPDAQTIYAETLCTNRQLAEQLPPGARLQVEFPVPAYGVTCLSKPTPQIAPPLHGATLWRLVSQLSLNHLSLDETVQFGVDQELRQALEHHHLSPELRQRFEHHGIALSQQVVVSAHTQAGDGASWLLTDQESGAVYTVIAGADQLSVYTGQEALPVLREMLALYSAAEPAHTYDLLMGIQAINCRRVVRRLGPQGLARGLEITLVFDESRYPARETMLFAAVLNRFFPLYASMNLWTQLVVKSKGHEGAWKRWPPIVGAQPIL
jgi:type VI protein secretion system component VasA